MSMIIFSSASRAFLLLAVVLPASVSAQTMDHAEMDMPVPAAASDPHAGHTMAPPTQDHSAHSGMDHSGMDHSAMEMSTAPEEADPHAGHHAAQPPKDHEAHSATDHRMAPSADVPREPIPPITPADRAAAFPDVGGHAVHDHSVHYFALFNRLEALKADSDTVFAWEGLGWIGTDLNRLWVRSEGARADGDSESAQLELLYGRATARWWDVVAGLRHEFESDAASQTFAALGVIGRAPYNFEVEVTAYLGESGQTAANVEAEYELLLTNRLILQPLLEVSWSGEADPGRSIGSGFSSVESGLRLRYEIRREFAPYIGVQWEKTLGNTADFARAAGERTHEAQWLVGLRAWF